MIDIGDGWIVTLSDKSFLNDMGIKERYDWWNDIKKVTRLEFTDKARAEETCSMLNRRTGLKWKIENSLFTGFYHEKRQRS